jgi:putative endonuclease
MALLAQLVYEALIRKERKRAQLASAAPRAAAVQVPGSASWHLETGRRGERLAYWYLRRMGYTVVARNLRGRRGAGELDLVAWEGPVLVFVEVKTRTAGDAGRPETAVTFYQQKRIAAAAQMYIRGLKQKAVNYRFDIVSVTWDQTEGYQLRLIKDAFKG